jgi:hypothetical protein
MGGIFETAEGAGREYLGTHTPVRHRGKQGGHTGFAGLFGLKEHAIYPVLRHRREDQEQDSGDELGGGLGFIGGS